MVVWEKAIFNFKKKPEKEALGRSVRGIWSKENQDGSNDKASEAPATDVMDIKKKVELWLQLPY